MFVLLVWPAPGPPLDPQSRPPPPPSPTTTTQVQFPDSKGFADDGYSQCPAPTSATVRDKMVEVAPSSMVPLPKELDQFKVSMWGNRDDMVRSSFETLGMAALRFTSKGSREICCVSLETAELILKTVYDKLEQPPPTPEVGRSWPKVLAECLQTQLGKSGLALLSELEGLTAFRTTLTAGSLCFVPSGYIWSERTVGGQFCYGWRTSIVESKGAVKVLDKLHKSGCWGPKSASALQEVVALATKGPATMTAGADGGAIVTGSANSSSSAAAADTLGALEDPVAPAGKRGATTKEGGPSKKAKVS